MGWIAFGDLSTRLRSGCSQPFSSPPPPPPPANVVQCMTPSGSESPRSISTFASRSNCKSATARPSTSRSRSSSLGFSGSGSGSGSGSAAVSPARSVTPTPAAGSASAATRARTPPRTRARTRTRTPTASTSKTPPMMSSAQTVTSTATESGSRFASSDAYRYAGTLHLPGTTSTLILARRNTVHVNATRSGSGSGSASHDSERGTMRDRHAYAYPHSQPYSQTQTHTDEESQSQRPGSHWSTRIAEIPIDAAEADAGSPRSAYGSNPVTAAGFAPSTDFPPAESHVGHHSGLYAPTASSGAGAVAGAGPSVFRPPSLARYALTPPAAQASSWRDTVVGFPSSSSSSSSAGWPPPSYTASDAFRGFDANTQRAARWGSPPSSAEGTASASFPPVLSSLALPRASPTHSGSPEDITAGAASSSWAPVPPATADSEESSQPRSASTYASKVLSTPAARPSSTRSSFASSSSSSSSLRVASFSGSGSSTTPIPIPTPATAAVAAAAAAASRVPEPATPYSLLPFAPQSPASPRSAPGIVGEPVAPFTSFAAAAVAGPSTSSSVSGQQPAQPSPPYDAQTHSPASARLARSGASPEHERQQQHEPAAFQDPLQQSGPARQASTGTGSGSGSGSGATASGPPGPGAARYPFVGTNTGSYSGPFGVSSDSDAGPLSLAARSSAPLLTVPVTITAAEPYDYPYSSPTSVPAPAPAPAFASASASAAGSSGGQNTRKKNHACWMCHKSFDRPSTLRKHLLVHTGEKAFVCNICGRRFGVASNLNRHTRRCIARPVNSSAFHTASTTSAAGPSTSASIFPTSDTVDAMAREQTNPDVRRSERERDGREVRDGDPPPPAPATPTTSESPARPTRGRRRARSTAQSAPLGAQSMNTSLPPEGGASSSSQRSPFQLRPAFGGGVQGAGQVAVAIASASTENVGGERRPKRRRRAPSPSRWVPASLRTFSLSPVQQRAPTPLPPVSPGYDAATGMYEERDSYATIADENVDPAGEASAASSSAGAAPGSNAGGSAARTHAERLRNFEYAPYHPCGWTGRLPGPAVVGSDLTNYAKPSGGGGSGSSRYSGGSTGGGLSFMFEFSLAAEG